MRIQQLRFAARLVLITASLSLAAGCGGNEPVVKLETQAPTLTAPAEKAKGAQPAGNFSQGNPSDYTKG